MVEQRQRQFLFAFVKCPAHCTRHHINHRETIILNPFVYQHGGGAEQIGPGKPWPIQYFRWMGHNAFDSPKVYVYSTFWWLPLR